jgi:hypothetical protein
LGGFSSFWAETVISRENEVTMLTEFSVAFAIVTVCVVIHVFGLLTMVEWLVRQRPKLQQKVGLRHYTPILIFTFAVTILLHFVETCIWAAFYHWNQLFPNLETSLYFSLASYTTIGYGDVVLPKTWRLLGAIEGISGVLLCGLSTAFIFAIVNALFQIRMEQINQPTS